MADSKKYDGSQWEHSLRKQTTASEIIVPPTTIYADGTAISTYTIKGNTTQSGTPSPSSPISVNGVGELETTGEHTGEYKIPISSGQQTIDIYIGDLPLLKSLDGTAVDEISNGTLTRRVDSDGSVLPTPTTTQITMPSIPTTEGANSITVDTTVQPSEFTATWTGWHNAAVKEKSENLLNSSTIQNGYTIASDTGLPISSEQRIATTTAMKIPQGTTAITVTYNSNNVGFMYSAFRNGTLIERVTTKATGSVLSLNNIDEIYFSWYTSGSTITTDDVTNIMVNTGSTALPYEPYWK